MDAATASAAVQLSDSPIMNRCRDWNALPWYALFLMIWCIYNLTADVKETKRNGTIARKKTAKRSVLKLAPIWINCEIVVIFSTRIVKWNASKSCLFVKHFNQCSDFVDFFHAISQPPTSHRFMIVFSARQLLCYWCCNLLNHTTVFCIVCHVTFQFFEIQSVCIWHG